MSKRNFVTFFLFFFLFCNISVAQISLGGIKLDDISYTSPKKLEIGGITVTGTEQLDRSALILLSGLSIGDKITVPGDEISSAITNLWRQELFDDIQISATNVSGGKIFINIHVKELPRLSRFKFIGINKTEADNIREEIHLYKEKIVNQNLITTTENTIRDYFVDKGYLNVEIDIRQLHDSVFVNHILLEIDIKKNKKVRIDKLLIQGNSALEDWQIRMAMKETKRKSYFRPFVEFDTLLFTSLKHIVKRDFIKLRNNVITYSSENLRMNIFKTSKYLDSNFDKDKQAVITKYNEKGYRDAKIVSDTIYKSGKRDIAIAMQIHEGKQYYFGNITWSGNSKYSTKLLNDLLGISKGDIYDKSLLETRLFMNPNGRDVSSLYMDDGYLFFQIDPAETRVTDNYIDIEMRIYEGQQARINKVTISGNTKTNDHVVMREIRTRPGQLFSRADIIRTQRELAQLGYFNAETLNVIPKPNPADGTVDIEYVVEEKSSDQIELSGGWGGGRIVGTLGVSFSNFSARNILKTETWSPLPAGDGQRLSIRAQSNGLFYQSYNMSFTEPWLGGRRPNALSLTAYHSVQTNGETKFLKEDKIFVRDLEDNKIVNPLRASVLITGLSVGLGRRLSWPDDYFTLYQEISYQHYIMNKWQAFVFSDGTANNLFYRFNISRNSIDQPIFPRTGSQLSLSVQATPPYSAFNNNDYSDPALSTQEKYKYIEYHKWKFTTSWFSQLVGNLVLNTRIGFGYLGSYNKLLGTAPLERFYLGGSGLSGYSLDGREIIALRGYDDNTLSPNTGASIINKYTMELRYPFSLNPSATIYGLGFVEAGKTWTEFGKYNPFNVYKSTGVGVRIFLPMFGLLGLDYAWRLDDVPEYPSMKRGQLHFTIGANLGEL